MASHQLAEEVRVRMLVFEAINDQLQEIFVGVSELPMFETIKRLRESPPPAIRHWNMRLAEFRSVEFELSRADAGAFIREYVKRPLAPGWRFLTEKLRAS